MVRRIFLPENAIVMKTHLITLFDASHWLKTISLFLLFAILETAAFITGITDNLPGIAMLIGGMVVLFFAILHPWKKAKNYGILAGIFAGIIVLIYVSIHLLDMSGLGMFISEGLVMSAIGLLCIPGIITGLLGALICGFKNKS